MKSKPKTSLVPKSSGTEKSVPDDTIYLTRNGTRVRIVKEKEYPAHRREIKSEPMFVVSEVANGKRWYGYKFENLKKE